MFTPFNFIYFTRIKLWKQLGHVGRATHCPIKPSVTCILCSRIKESVLSIFRSRKISANLGLRFGTAVVGVYRLRGSNGRQTVKIRVGQTLVVMSRP